MRKTSAVRLLASLMLCGALESGGRSWGQTTVPSAPPLPSPATPAAGAPTPSPATPAAGAPAAPTDTAQLLLRLQQLESEVQDVRSLRNQVYQLQSEISSLRGGRP